MHSEGGCNESARASNTSIDNPNRLESYLLGEYLGSGLKSMVYLATCIKGRLYGRKVALKIVKFQPPASVLEITALASTIATRKSLQHPALVSLHSSFTVNDSHYIVLELCDGGNLRDLIVSPLSRGADPTLRLSEIRLRPIVRSLAEALAYLHSQGVIYGDIQAGKILFTSDGRVKLGGVGNFGPSLSSGSSVEAPFPVLSNTSKCIMTSANNTLSFFEDIRSLGYFIVSLLTASPTVKCLTLEESYTFPSSLGLSHQLEDMVYGLLKNDPKQQTSLQKLLAHSFLNPSSPNQPMTPPVHLNAKKPGLGITEAVDPGLMGAFGKLTVPTVAHLKDKTIKEPKGKILGRLPYRMPSGGISLSSATVDTTRQSLLKTIPRPRLYSASSVLTCSMSRRTEKTVLSCHQSEGERKPTDPSQGHRNAAATGLELGPQKTARKALGEIGNIRTSFERFRGIGIYTDKLAEIDRKIKEQQPIPSDLLSPPDIHPDKPLSRKDTEQCSSGESSSPSSSSSTSSDPGLASQRHRSSWDRGPVAATEVMSLGRPIPIPRTSPPKCLQVTPLLSQTHKTPKGQIVVLPSCFLLVDLREGERRAGGRGDCVLYISPDGREIKVYMAPRLSTPCVLSEPQETWVLDELPERYWESYAFASKYLDSVKKRTPWMVWYTPNAKFTVMSNGPKGDIQVSFPCPSHGLKERRYVSGGLVDSFTKMKIKFSRQQDVLKISRYAPSHGQRGGGGWISKSETITETSLKHGSDYSQKITLEERQGLDCLVEGLKLAEAAEEIYMVATQRTPEGDLASASGAAADHALKPDLLRRMTRTCAAVHTTGARSLQDFQPERKKSKPTPGPSGKPSRLPHS